MNTTRQVNGHVIIDRDEDLNSFTASSTDSVTFDLDACNSSPISDTALMQFDSAGNLLASSDTAAAPGETPLNDPFIACTVSMNGTS